MFQELSSILQVYDKLRIKFLISHIRPPAELDQEIWLKDVVLASFPDTRDCSPSLVRSIIVGCKVQITNTLGFDKMWWTYIRAGQLLYH